MGEIILSSRLSALQEIHINTPDSEVSSAEKKQHRIRTSLEYTSSNVGFMHGVLIGTNFGNFLISGESGVGKTTYASMLQERDKDSVIFASDWVAVEKDGDQFYASDLNYASQLRHDKRVKLEGVLMLKKHDPHQRDIYAPNNNDFVNEVENVFDTCDSEDKRKLAQFWIENRKYLNHVAIIPTHDKDTQYVGETIRRHIQSITSMPDEPVNAAVIGLGRLGSELAFQLGQSPSVGSVYALSKDVEKTRVISSDLNQGITKRGDVDVIIPTDNPHEVFSNADHVFITFRDPTPLEGAPLEPYERWTRILPHLRLVKEYTRAACESNFNGTIHMVTNPVDFMAYACYASSQDNKNSLRTHQVYSVGLSLDAIRAVSKARTLGLSSSSNIPLRLVGNHADIIRIADSPYDDTTDKSINGYLQTASSDITKHVERTVYGPASSARLVMEAILLDNGIHVGCIQDNAHIGHWVNFSDGLPENFSEEESLAWRSILEINLARIQKYNGLIHL